MVESSFGFIGFGKTSIPNQGSTFQKTNLDGCEGDIIISLTSWEFLYIHTHKKTVLVKYAL
jgi:hypothetical protein